MVGDPGLEPGWVTPHAPQTCASTSSASRPAVSRLILPLELSAMASKVGMRSHDHDDVEAEPFLDESVDLFGDALRRGSTRQHHVAAWHVSAHVAKSLTYESGAQLGHRNAVVTDEVDAAQKGLRAAGCSAPLLGP